MSDSKNRSGQNSNELKGGEIVSVAVNDKFAHIEPIQAVPLEVVVHGSNFEKAMRFFRSKVQKERVISLYKEKQTYEKPSDKKRRKRSEMRRKMLEVDNKSEDFQKPRRKNKKASTVE
jgi:ribosomal protein S21